MMPVSKGIKMNVAETVKIVCDLSQQGEPEDVNYIAHIEKSAMEYTKYSTKKGKHVAFLFHDQSALVVNHFEAYTVIRTMCFHEFKTTCEQWKMKEVEVDYGI